MEEGVEELMKDSYLMLVSTKHNSSLGNKNFSDKVKDYGRSNLIMQQKEIHDEFVNQENPVWDKAEIEKGGRELLKKRWKYGI